MTSTNPISTEQTQQPKTWTKETYLISTDNSLLSIPAINDAFAQDFMYWTNALPEPILEELLNSSCCFGLYETSSACAGNDQRERKQIGLARLITDRVTFAYLTDVYVLPSHRDLGLGGWLLDCVNEYLEGLPYLRWSMLRTSKVRSKEAYGKSLGTGVLENGPVAEGGEEGGPWMTGKQGRGCLA